MTSWIDKWKEKLEKFFEPFKNAWENEGMQTVNSAQNAFEKIKETIGSMGTSFSEVWQNGTGQKTIETVLSIFQKIFDTIGEIAGAWEEAWNTDNKGTELIQALWDALNNLLELIENIKEKVKEFASSPIVQEYFQNAI